MGRNGAPRAPFSKAEQYSEAKTIRTIQELEPLLDKLVRCLEGIFITDMNSYGDRLRSLISNGGTIYYVEDSAGNIVGTVSIHRDHKIAFERQGSRTVYGYRFLNGAVSPDHRRSGIYTKLNTARIEEAVKQKAEYVDLYTQNPNIELSLRDTFDALKRERGSTIKKFRMDPKKEYRSSEKPVTHERPPKCGVKEIDKRYNSLDYDKGEWFRVTVWITYK